MPIDCKILFNNSSPHLNQILTGFGILELKKIIEIEYILGNYPHKPSSSTTNLRVIIDNSKIVYDMFDGENIDSLDYEWSDIYIKRSYSSIHRDTGLNKMIPYGFNYSIFGPNDHYENRILKDLELALRTKTMQPLHQIIKNNIFLSKYLKTSSGRSNSYYSDFESLPTISSEPKIIFFTRLWEPKQNASIRFNDERKLINEMRIGIVELLSKHYPKNFVGGIEPTIYAMEKIPHLIVPKKMVKKRTYLKSMQSADITIATRGLLNSNGWKMAEYIASSKAIVSEKLFFDIPGDFSENKNYLAFSTVEECLEKVDRLMFDDQLRLQMMWNNFAYYQSFLRPDVLILKTLEIIHLRSYG